MASQIEVHISTTESDNVDATNTSTADHEYRSPADWSPVKMMTNVAIVIWICALPGWALTVSLIKANRSSIFTVIGLVLLQYLYMLMIAMCHPHLWGRPNQLVRSPAGIGGIYYKSQMTSSALCRVVVTSLRLFFRIGLLISWGMIVVIFVPKFRMLTLLGSPLWRWSLLALTVHIALSTSVSVCIIPGVIEVLKLRISRKGGKQYPYNYNGLFKNLMLVLYLGIILGVWLGYFRTEHGLNNPAIRHPEAFDYVTWICVSLFIGSILLLIKSYILMLWSTKAIYCRFQPRIVMTGVKFLFLGLITRDFFLPPFIYETELLEEYKSLSESHNYSFQKYIMSKHVSTAHLQVVGRYLKCLANIVKSLQDEGLTELLDYLSEKITSTSDICQTDDLVKLIDSRYVSDKNLGRQLNNLWFKEGDKDEYCKNIANVLHRIVLEQSQSATGNEFTFEDLKRWMVDAHVNCVNMGRTLADASAIVTRLDMIISIIISVLVVLMWLLISGIASTKVLVAIGAPVLTFSFVFGESTKMFFQGLIFCFASHSFDVGDRCIIDDTELEVKRISILTTEFTKIGTGDRRMYPNSLLATKPIINKGWEPDPSDKVELKFEMSTFRKQWEALEIELERLFKDDQHKGVFQSWHEVTMEEIDDKIKVTIHFKHVLNVKEMTHNQCFQKKIRQRPIILKCITRFLEPGHHVGNGTPLNSSGRRLWNGLA